MSDTRLACSNGKLPSVFEGERTCKEGAAGSFEMNSLEGFSGKGGGTEGDGDAMASGGKETWKGENIPTDKTLGGGGSGLTSPFSGENVGGTVTACSGSGSGSGAGSSMGCSTFGECELKTSQSDPFRISREYLAEPRTGDEGSEVVKSGLAMVNLPIENGASRRDRESDEPL